jgi:hypothetical protein
MPVMTKPASEVTDHRFLDEAGDTTFYGSGHKLILGQDGVSHSFIIGMLRYPSLCRRCVRPSPHSKRPSRPTIT